MREPITYYLLPITFSLYPLPFYLTRAITMPALIALAILCFHLVGAGDFDRDLFVLVEFFVEGSSPIELGCLDFDGR